MGYNNYNDADGALNLVKEFDARRRRRDQAHEPGRLRNSERHGR